MSNKTINQEVSVKLLSGNTLLFLAFFFAKITGYINWSWFWVFSPIWFPAAIIIGILLLIIVCSALRAK